MPESLSNLQKVKLYLKSIEDGDFAPIAELFAAGSMMEQLPNRIYPDGLRSPFSKFAEAFEKGRELLSSQTYEIKHHVVNGDDVVVEVLWIGRLAIAFGSLSVGSEMRAHSAMFFKFQDGKIVSQRNYDCFEPW